MIGPKTRVVLFDHDDTLVRTIEAKWAAHKHIARTQYGKELMDDELRSHWGKPLRQLVCLLYGDEDAERALAREAATHDQFPKLIFDDTLPVLRHLHKTGKKLGVITATSRKSLDYDLNSLGIDSELFAFLQTQDDTEFHKPDPRVFEPVHAWLNQSGISPGEVVYIGDGLHDMRAALGAGFDFIGVSTGLVAFEEFENTGTRAIRRLAELMK